MAETTLSFELDGYEAFEARFREPTVGEFQGAAADADEGTGLLETFCVDGTDFSSMPIRQYVGVTRALRDFLVPDDVEASWRVVDTSSGAGVI